jgi:hypothetical protein
MLFAINLFESTLAQWNEHQPLSGEYWGFEFSGRIENGAHRIVSLKRTIERGVVICQQNVRATRLLIS